MSTKKEGAQDHHYIKRVKRMVQDTKKMGSPAQKIVKEIMKFPQFQVTIFNLFVIILCTFESRKGFNWKGWKGHFKNHAICRPLKKKWSFHCISMGLQTYRYTAQCSSFIAINSNFYILSRYPLIHPNDRELHLKKYENTCQGRKTSLENAVFTLSFLRSRITCTTLPER